MKRIIEMLIIVALVATIGSCKTIKVVEQVPVPVHDTVRLVQKDIQVQVDSVIVERETIVREADSALLAEYGMKLKDGERTILVLRKELERQKNTAVSKTSDTVYQFKEVPVQVTKYVEVERKLTKWQKFLMWVGRIGLIGLLGYIGWKWGWWKKIYEAIKGWIKR